jgi:hypothetical protein
MLAIYLELTVLNLLKVMLFSLISFETQTCTIFCELICNIISAATLCM